MKKIILIVIAVITYSSIHAQLDNTKWIGTLLGDNPQRVTLDFKKDKLEVYTISDSSLVEAMTCVFKDRTFTLKKIEGQSDCDNIVVGKYEFRMNRDSMFIKVLDDVCQDRSSALDATKWVKFKNHPEVKVDASILKQYVGVYELDAQHQVTITLDNGRLYAESVTNNLPKSPLFPESDSRFFIKIAAVSMDFVKDKNGKVIKFISHEDKDYELKKIK
jgi:hypothetical protein